MQNIDGDGDESFKCFLVGYLHYADHQPAKITKYDKNFGKKTWFYRHKISSQNLIHLLN